jgi:hypothetical protein
MAHHLGASVQHERQFRRTDAIRFSSSLAAGRARTLSLDHRKGEDGCRFSAALAHRLFLEKNSGKKFLLFSKIGLGAVRVPNAHFFDSPPWASRTMLTRVRMSAFAVAIGGKALHMSANDPKRTWRNRRSLRKIEYRRDRARGDMRRTAKKRRSSGQGARE